MPDDDEKKPQANEGEDKGSRMDAAKAFFRAMYAGEESADQQAAPQGSAADSRRVKELEQQSKEFEQRATDAENLYKRMAADFDNFRRRMEREREEFTNAGVRKAFEAFIPALDDLDRALMYLTPESPAEKVIESFQLVASRINQCLEQAGLKRLNTKGVIFDPRFHEPVQQIETSEHPDGMIVHELRGGYAMGDRIVRPALVNVASNNSVSIEPVAEFKQEADAKAASSGESPAQAQSASVATATEVKPDESAAKPQAAADNNVYDLGNLDDLV